MSKWTPGPWVILPLHGKYYGTRIELPNGNLIEVWTTGDKYEASSREIENGWTPEVGLDHVETAECYANARLISKAPELVEALKAMLKKHSGGIADTHGCFPEHEQARALLKEIEGE